MQRLSKTEFTGRHRDPDTQAVYSYQGLCEIAVDVHGRESLHVRARVRVGDHEHLLTKLGYVDHRGSFVGREIDVARSIVERAFAAETRR